MLNINDNNEMDIKLIQALLTDTSFVGFSFDTNFTLKFCRMGSAIFNGKTLPLEIKITILSDWWMGSTDEWNELVSKFDTTTAIEPSEPIQAFELAILRWSENSDIKNVTIDNKNFAIVFQNGKSINISCDSLEDFAWIIEEVKHTSNKNEWSIVCENDKIFIKGIGN